MDFLDCKVSDLINRPNLTSEWFKEHWGEVVPMLTSLLSKRFRKSRESDFIQDLIMDFVLKYISKDGFRPIFEKGGKPTMGSIRMFAVRTSIDRLRKNGSDYCLRVNYGSKTGIEYRRDTQFYTPIMEDRFNDNAELRVYFNEKINDVLDEITFDAEPSRDQDLEATLVDILSGVDGDTLSDRHESRNINRVRKVLKYHFGKSDFK